MKLIWSLKYFRENYNFNWGMGVYIVKKSKVLLELISEKDRDLELSGSYSEFLRIHIW